MTKYLHVSARALIALIFIISGLGKIAAFSQTKSFMAAAGLPLPELLLIATIGIEVAGGICLFAGYKTKAVAAILAAFLVPVTAVFHAAHLGDPGQAQLQLVEVLKNLAIIGGLLKVAADGAGSLAIDHISRQRPVGSSVATTAGIQP
jgi:putative oxidoreductase